jgi:hypothetical protein
VHRSIAVYLDKLKFNSRGSQNDVQNPERGKTVDLTERRLRTEDAISHALPTDDVEDAGWDSEQSNTDPDPTFSRRSTHTNLILDRAQSPKRQHSPKLVFHTRRRTAAHRSSSSHGHSLFFASPNVHKRGSESGRGRSLAHDAKRHARPSTAPNSRMSSRLNSPAVTRHSSLKNLRLDQIKAHDSRTSGDSSPSRSIRFADDETNAFPSRPTTSYDPHTR